MPPPLPQTCAHYRRRGHIPLTVATKTISLGQIQQQREAAHAGELRRNFPHTMKNRLPDPSEICLLHFSRELRQFGICSVSATIGINWSIFDVIGRGSGYWLGGKKRANLYRNSLKQHGHGASARHSRRLRDARHVGLIPATHGPWYEASEHDVQSIVRGFVSSKPTSCRGNCSAVDDVLGAGDGSCARRNQECDQICYFLRPGRPPERNAAKALHDDLLAAFVVSASLRGEPFSKATAASVSTQPGETRTTRTPLGVTSFERLLL